MPRIWLAIVAVVALLSGSISAAVQSGGSAAGHDRTYTAAGNQDTSEADAYPLAVPIDLACPTCEATADASLSLLAPAAWRRKPTEEGKFFLHGISVRPHPFPPKQKRAISNLADSRT